MTITEYLKNPYGKGSAFSSKKQQEDLDKQFAALSEKIVSKIYRYRDEVIYHVVIPSTSKDTVNYDVIIDVETKNLHSGAANLEDLSFRAFSNCPSFIFTYANVFRSNNMLCEWLLPKYNKEVRTKAPTTRNQYNIVGLERSLYLALKHLHTSGKTKVGVYQTSGKKISGRTEVINSVRSQEQIMEKVKEKITPDKTTTESGKSEGKFEAKVISTNKHQGKNTKEKKVLFTKSIKNTKKASKTKSTKTSKTVKKINKF